MEWKPYPVKERIKITEMFTFFTYHYDDAYEFPGETHNFWECVYVLDGSICVTSDERIYNLSAGEIIFHKPLELHKFRITEKSGATLLIFSFSAVGSLQKYFFDKVFALDDNQRRIITDMLSYADSYADETVGILGKYMSAMENVRLYSQNIALDICRLLLSLAESSNILPIFDSPDSVIFANTVKFMSDNICKNLSVEDFARNASTSVSGIKRIFSRYAGMGAHKYFLKLKLKTATEMLSEGQTITSIAETLGFSSQGYFTKVFKRETGNLPSYVRKSVDSWGINMI